MTERGGLIGVWLVFWIQVICVVLIPWVQWLAVTVAAVLSSRFLIRNLLDYGPNLTPDTPAAVDGAADYNAGPYVCIRSPSIAARFCPFRLCHTFQFVHRLLPVVPGWLFCPYRSQLKRNLLMVMAAVGIMHVGLAVATKFYFVCELLLCLFRSDAQLPVSLCFVV